LLLYGERSKRGATERRTGESPVTAGPKRFAVNLALKWWKLLWVRGNTLTPPMAALL
jgi:hypothetical protein